MRSYYLSHVTWKKKIPKIKNDIYRLIKHASFYFRKNVFHDPLRVNHWRQISNLYHEGKLTQITLKVVKTGPWK